MTTTVLNKLTKTRPLSIADLEEILGQRCTTEPPQPAPDASNPRARATTKLELPSDWLHTEAGSESRTQLTVAL